MSAASTDLLLWGYVALAFLAALALMISTLPGWARVLLLAGVTGLYFVADETLGGVWGWPSRDALPERFVLIAAVIEEPSQRGDGALYVWVNALKDGKPAPMPRAFRLPYAKDLHALLNEAMMKTRQGVTQLGTAEPKSGPQGASWLRPGNAEQSIKIRDLPVPQLPEK